MKKSVVQCNIFWLPYSITRHFSKLVVGTDAPLNTTNHTEKFRHIKGNFSNFQQEKKKFSNSKQAQGYHRGNSFNNSYHLDQNFLSLIIGKSDDCILSAILFISTYLFYLQENSSEALTTNFLFSFFFAYALLLPFVYVMWHEMMMLFNDLRKLGGAGKQDAGKPLNVEWFFSTNLFFFSIIGPIHFTFHCWCYYYFYEIARRPTAHYIQRENTSWFVRWHKNGISYECNLEPVASKFFLKLVSSITSLYNPWPITPAPCCLLPPSICYCE